MNITENCLNCLKEKDWLKLNQILSDENNCNELASDPIFVIFEQNLVSEIQRYEQDENEDLCIVLARIFQLNKNSKILKLSENCALELAKYLFDKNPSETYARFLPKSEVAQDFLNKQNDHQTSEIEKNIIGSNLDIRIGFSGELDFSKSIFNSPQEKELFSAAKKTFKDDYVMPNIALSTIINSKVLELLDDKSRSFFFKSTLDLCVIDSQTDKPKIFLELDSSWHDKPNQIENDRIKNKIFEKAGMELHRLRKKVNKSMTEVFELYIEKNYES